MASQSPEQVIAETPSKVSSRAFTPKLDSDNLLQQVLAMFSQLPSELRLQIWRATFPGPRTIMIELAPTSRQVLPALDFSSHSVPSPFNDYHYFENTEIRKLTRTDTPPPPVFGVCRESRYEALRTYLPLGRCDLSRCHIYFDPKKDAILMLSAIDFPPDCRCPMVHKICHRCRTILSLDNERLYLGGILHEEIWSKIQYMVLDVTQWIRSAVNGILHKLKSLKELTIVTPESHDLSCYRTGKRVRHGMEFIDLERADNLSAFEIEGVRYIRQSLVRICSYMEEQFPDWKRPKIIVKVQRRR